MLAPAPASAAIVVRDLVKRYGDIVAVNGVSFTVMRGTTTALLGGNGAGKTTTLSILLGVLTPTSGAIEVLGVDMLRARYRALPRMNFTSPYVDLPKRLTVRENLRVFADLYGVARPKERIVTTRRVSAVAKRTIARSSISSYLLQRDRCGRFNWVSRRNPRPNGGGRTYGSRLASVRLHHLVEHSRSW